MRQGVLWAGSNDGLVHVSQDGGANWTNVTSNIPDLPPLGTVRNIDASKWDAGKVYLTVDFHQVGNFAPYVYKTEDFGQSWTKITDGIADNPLSYARNVREDPVRPGLLYLGTENALYVSFDDGGGWQPLKNNLPASPIYWLVVQEHFKRLGCRNLRSRLLDSRRHHAAPAAHGRGNGFRRSPLRAPAGLPLPAYHAAHVHADRRIGWRRSALRSLHQLLDGERGRG